MRCREDDPAVYLRLVASLAPKKLDVDQTLTLVDYLTALAAEHARDAAEGAEEVVSEPAAIRH